MEDINNPGRFIAFDLSHMIPFDIGTDIMAATNNVGQVRTMDDALLFRQHLFLDKIGCGTHFQLKLIKVASENITWFYERKHVAPPIKIIAVIVDEEGNFVKFDDSGGFSATGRPFGIAYEYFYYYLKENLAKKGKTILQDRKQPDEVSKTSIAQKYVSNRILDKVIKLLDTGHEIIADIYFIENDTIASCKSTKTSICPNGNVRMRTIEQMKSDGYIAENQYPDVQEFTSSITYRDELHGVKLGQPYVYDFVSEKFIPLEGKIFKDITVNKIKIFENTETALYKILDALDKNEVVGCDFFTNSSGEIIFTSELIEDIPTLYHFIKDVLSPSVYVSLDSTRKNIRISKRGILSKVSIWDMPICFQSFEVKDPRSASLVLPLSYDEYYQWLMEVPYVDFVNENFFSSAIPSQVEGRYKIKKENKRIVYTQRITLAKVVSEQDGSNVKCETKGNIALLRLEEISEAWRKLIRQ